MKLTRLKRYLKEKEVKHPRVIRPIRKVARVVSRTPPTYPKLLRREIEAVTDVLHSPFWNMNSGASLVHEKLEEEFAAYVGTRYAVAVNSGGMAIQMALRALGLKPGDEVIHQVDTCVANAFAVIAAGATPVFADISTDNFMLSRTSTEAHISPQTKVIMPIHMWGYPENLDWIIDLAKKHNLYTIEDACLALGAESKGRKAGSSADAGVFSFGSLKPIQAGEGGIITTNDEALAKELRVLRNWGDTTAEYGIRDQKVLSWNGRISEIVAAVALEQLRGYTRHFEMIQEHVAVFFDRLTGIDGIEVIVPRSANVKPAYSQVTVKLNSKILGVSKTELMESLRARGIGVWHANFEPINWLTFFRDGNWRDWVLRGDLDRIDRNYQHKFEASEYVYEEIGLGFAKNNFLSKAQTNLLIKELKNALAH
jgi:dTDP-4-amino-4,6-dideoxygalactose transaminase